VTESARAKTVLRSHRDVAIVHCESDAAAGLALLLLLLLLLLVAVFSDAEFNEEDEDEGVVKLAKPIELIP
jgi:hypothetical protein